MYSHEGSKLLVIRPPTKTPPFPFSLHDDVLVPPHFGTPVWVGLTENGGVPRKGIRPFVDGFDLPDNCSLSHGPL